MLGKKQIEESVPTCITNTLKILGDKWTPLLVKELTECPKTYSELELGLNGISPRTLSQRLDKLEDGGILAKQKYCQHPPRYRYGLTDKGSALKKIISEMAEWDTHYSS